jgi:hypothetical protein
VRIAGIGLVDRFVHTTKTFEFGRYFIPTPRFKPSPTGMHRTLAPQPRVAAARRTLGYERMSLQDMAGIDTLQAIPYRDAWNSRPSTQGSRCAANPGLVLFHRNKQKLWSMSREEGQGDTSGGVRFRHTDRFPCGLDDEFPKQPHVPRPSRAMEPPGRTIPEGNAYPSPGLPSGAPATPGTMPKKGSFLKGMHRGIWLRLGS